MEGLKLYISFWACLTICIIYTETKKNTQAAIFGIIAIASLMGSWLVR